MTALLKLVPVSVWVGIAVAALVIGGAWAIDQNGYNRGVDEVRVEWENDRLMKEAEIRRLKDEQAKVVEKVTVEYRDRVKVIKEKGDEVLKLVPYFLRGECLLTGAWRVLHDAAASGAVPDDPDRAIATADPVAGLAAAETVASNYAACRADQARLAALQQLLKGASQ